MKNVDSIKGMVKRLFVFTMLTVLPLFAAAQQLTVTVESEGQLGAQLPDSIRYSMTDLKICGPLNVNDLKIIQALTSRVKAKKSSEQVLTSLDLSEAEIIESKGVVRTRANVLPAAMFLNCKTIERIILPNTLTEISRSCFSGCINLKEVSMSDATEQIGDYAFNNCVSLENLTLSSHLKAIENHAFDGCVSLSEVKLPETVTLIDAYAFNNCKALEEINIEGTEIKRINDNVFSGCQKLKNVELPQSVTAIGNDAFINCTACVLEAKLSKAAAI